MKQESIEAPTVENSHAPSRSPSHDGSRPLDIYRLRADRQFPQSIKLGIRAVGWLERE